VIREIQAVLVVGADVAGFPTLDGEVNSSVFDDDADSWTLTTSGGQTCRTRVVITGASPFVPWIPNLPCRNDFCGATFPAAAPDPEFDPAGKRVAVIGGDGAAGRLIDRLATSAASVEVFPLPPRRVIRNATRWRRRRTSAAVVASPIDRLTASGIRTRDGVHHDADAIVYGTGFAIRDPRDTLVGARGLTLPQAWHDGTEPYLGVAVHGFPNYFLVNGPDTARYVASCLRLMHGHSRIEVRRSSQQVFNERVYLRSPRLRVRASAYELSAGAHDDAYDGPATLTIAGTDHQVRVRLIGRVEPVDGQYHWQGTVFGQLPTDLLRQSRAVTLAAGERSAPARITEETPQGTHSIAGVGPPPFALPDVEHALRVV
jgi:cation diffusion facilitator CzcD-associated flavoprotein CzcO